MAPSASLPQNAVGCCKRAGMASRRLAVPVDDDDCRFTKSFSEPGDAEALEFFRVFGFVVFRDVVEPECVYPAAPDPSNSH